MIKQLTIKNLAIIDDITIDFDENLNILTGETGAGKSIIIDAISLVFGARASNEIVSYGKEFAYISAVLYLKPEIAKYILDNYEIDVTEECIISRTISLNNKSNCKINGMIVPLRIIQEISTFLIDISSQNESQYLFNHKNHLSLLDTYIEKKYGLFKNKYSRIYQEYLKVKEQYDDLNAKQFDEQQLEFLNFKLNELNDFNYSNEDIESINKEYKELITLSQNIEKFEEINDYLNNDTSGCLNNLYSAIKQLSKLSLNEKISSYYERFNSLYLDLLDASDSFNKDFLNNYIDFTRIDYLSNEITNINRLKRKYNVNDLLKYKNDLIKEIETLNNREIELSKLNNKLNNLKQECLAEAKIISKIRNKYSLMLSNDVKNELNELFLLDASFSIHFNECEELNSNGVDDVQFYMSANKGIPERPLIKVASGGEVSRILLGLKSVFSSLMNVDIIIFDEIDTGVSGKVASSMGLMMKKIAKNIQVLAITHLPQVAALSDHHYFISKICKDNKTFTNVSKLDENAKIHEIARLLSGNNTSDSFINAAKELIFSK